MAVDVIHSWWNKREALLDRYRSEEARYLVVARALRRQISDMLKDEGIAGSAHTRVKKFDAFFRKLLERAAEEAEEIRDPFLFITDLVGIRVVVPFMEDIGKVHQLLRDNFELTEEEEKGAALSVREFGYTSTHLLIAVPPEMLEDHGPLSVTEVEIQLRTTLQDAWAEVEHELVYKAGLDVVNDQVQRKLIALNATLSLADTIFQEIRDYQKQRSRTLRAQHQDLMDKVSTIPEKMGRVWRGEEPISAGAQLGEIDRPGTVDETQDADAHLSNLILRALQAHLDADLDTAVRLYSKVLAVQPAYAIYNHRGIAYFTMSQYEKAIADFSAAIELEPHQVRAYTNRGLAYRMAERHTDALADFDRSLAIDPYWADTLYGRALTHFDMGNIPAALTDCDRAIAVKPDFKQVLRFKRFVQGE
ncbi:MAG: tetratricopeptide repeat protein [Deltaproteobacteria bacterium]|nr:tetratricopeptide repeat protein [Deltaproteobacteria bacterium]